MEVQELQEGRGAGGESSNGNGHHLPKVHQTLKDGGGDPTEKSKNVDQANGTGGKTSGLGTRNSTIIALTVSEVSPVFGLRSTYKGGSPFARESGHIWPKLEGGEEEGHGMWRR